MTNKTTAAIEEAAKLPTALEVFNKHTNQRMMHEPYIIAAMQEYADSHTAAHTASLWSDIKQLQRLLDNSLEVGEELRERVKELETTLSINRYTIEDMRKSFYAGHSLCDDEWRNKTKLTGFDEFIDNLK